MSTELQKCQTVLRHIANTTTNTTLYKASWSDRFRLEEIDRAMEATYSQIGQIHFEEMTKEELISIGCCLWDDESGYLLLPTWAYRHLPYEVELVSIAGESKVVQFDYMNSKSPNYIDSDSRMGCLAYGLKR